MTERISHEKALEVVRRANGEGTFLERYITQQQALEADTVSPWREAIERALGLEPDPENHTPAWAEELVREIREIGNADTVSRAELEEALAEVRKLWAQAGRESQAQLTAQRAELEGQNHAVVKRLGEVLVERDTERARAEEAERRFKVAVDDCAFAVDGREALRTELAAANARVARLEEELTKWREIGGPERSKLVTALSTAPQASTEQALPSPAVGERRPECPHGVGLCTSSCPSKQLPERR